MLAVFCLVLVIVAAIIGTAVFFRRYRRPEVYPPLDEVVVIHDLASKQSVDPVAQFVPPSDRPAKVLVVDDDADVADIIGIMLTQLGCEVATDGAASAALKRLASGYIPDLIISDVRMPEKNGFELACDVALHYPAVPMILMTGYYNEMESRPLRWRLLHKPIAKKDLAAVVRPATDY
jgi:CheY-like chemotaxis protein